MICRLSAVSNRRTAALRFRYKLIFLNEVSYFLFEFLFKHFYNIIYYMYAIFIIIRSKKMTRNQSEF